MDWFLFILVINASGQAIGNDGNAVARLADEGMCHLVGHAVVDTLIRDAQDRRIPSAFDFTCIKRAGS